MFRGLSKKGYKHYYEGTIEELDSMDKSNPNLHSEIMQVVMWLYNKHGIWISVIDVEPTHTLWEYQISKKEIGLIHSSGQYPAKHESSPTEAYEAAIQYCLRMMISDYPM